MSQLHHAVVVRVQGNVGVNVAVACVHMQRDEDAAPKDFGVNGVDLGADFFKGVPCEDMKKPTSQFLFPRNTQYPVVNSVKNRLLSVIFKNGVVCRNTAGDEFFPGVLPRCIEQRENGLPPSGDFINGGERFRHRGVEKFLFGNARGHRGIAERNVAAQVLFGGACHVDFVADGTFDVKSFAGQGIFPDPVQRNDNVFV